MNNLSIISLILGFIGGTCLILSFVSQLYTIYTTKNTNGTSWGLILFQILTCFALGSSASINVYLDGIINLPFAISNGALILLFILMAYLKYQNEKNESEN